MRAMVYTGDARHRGGAARVTAPCSRSSSATSCAPPRARWRPSIAAKSPDRDPRRQAVLNGIDPVDVKRSYRFEQGFTFELNLSGVADEARDAFVEKRDAKLAK